MPIFSSPSASSSSLLMMDKRSTGLLIPSPHNFAFLFPPFLISLEHLSTVSHAKFLKCSKQKTSLEFFIPYFLLGGPYCINFGGGVIHLSTLFLDDGSKARMR